MSVQGTKIRNLDLIVAGDVLIEAAENLKSAWDLPENLDDRRVAALLSQHLELWLEDFCHHPDFFLKDNSRLKKEVKALADESELESVSTLAA